MPFRALTFPFLDAEALRRMDALTYYVKDDYVVKVEIRAVYLKSMRQKRGLTQRQLAKDIGISQNYIPALEAGARRPGRNVQERLLNYFGCGFDDLFEIVLVDPETSDERILQPTAQRPGATKR